MMKEKLQNKNQINSKPEEKKLLPKDLAKLALQSLKKYKKSYDYLKDK